MNKTTKIAFIVFITLIIAVIPLYYYTHPDIAQPKGTLQIKGAVDQPTNLTLTELEAYTVINTKVTVNGHQSGNGNFTYTGVTLVEILNRAQIQSDTTSVYIQASDGYGTTLTIEEVQKPSVFIAYKKDGTMMSSLSEGGEGPFRLIIADDEFSQRWIRDVVAIEVK